ncbi:WD-40 repeat-containing protein [Calothrix sp. NIES-4101]|nr:WD-40 repeat-containing protein [Calothrix sp. NIES-4101]
MSKHNFNCNFAIIIGINNYKNKNIKNLETAESDAQKLADIIKTQHQSLKEKYQKENEYKVRLLLNEEANIKQLKKLIEYFKKGRIPLDNEKVTVTKDDRLFFYFAGHGIALDALENQEGPVGYLIPQSATPGDSSTYLPMQELHDALNALPCRHMLAILDCCFAGAFRWASLQREIVPKVKVYKERYDRFISDRAWQVITSAADDQKALDSLGSRGIVTEGNEVHSPFAKALFDALCGQADESADLNKDGIITATELYLYLRDKVEILTEKHYKRQTPSLCPLRKHDKGEFIFLLPNFDRDKLDKAPELNPENNPYRGLQPYDEEHSHLFFGRENLIKKLYQKVVDRNNVPIKFWLLLLEIDCLAGILFLRNSLTVVLGVSGTGKSSLMKAGLLPRLRNSQKQKFEILEPMRPGESPLKSLAQICLPITNTITAEELATDEEALANIIESWSRNNPKTKVLLTVDQFEELITLCKSDAERGQFQKLIKNAIAKYPDKIHVVITLRLDFEAQFQNSVLLDFWNDDTRFVVPPMTQDELREVIEKPALEKVLYFDPPGLVDELINEVVQMPGALPLLSFTLSELYLKYSGDRRRDNRALTKKDYEELGRVVGSITKRANQEYEKLVGEDPAYKDTVRRVMLRMISLQGGELARRQVPKSELEYPDKEENNRVQTVIKRFSDARLIVEGSDSQSDPYVEPAHDTLVQGWKKLQDWKNNDRENLLLQQLLTPSAQEWKNNKQAMGFLWDDNPRILLLQQVLKSNDIWLNKLEIEFVQYSLKERDRIDIDNLKARAKEELQSNKQLEALSTAVEAVKKLQQFLSMPEIKIHINKNQIEKELRQIIYSVGELNRLEGHKHWLWCVNFSPNGKYLATACADGTLKLWSCEGKELLDINAHEGEVIYVCFSPDSQIIATAGYDGTVKFWDIKGEELEPKTIRHNEAVWCVSFSPDGERIVTASDDTNIKLWDRKGKEDKQFRCDNKDKHQREVKGVTFSPDGQLIATASFDKTVKIWNLQGKVIRAFKDDKNGFNNVSFSPDGQFIVAACDDRTVRLWSLEDNLLIFWCKWYYWLQNTQATEAEKFDLWFISLAYYLTYGRAKVNKILRGHTDWVKCVSFSPNGQLIASGSSDNTIKLWNREGEELKTLKGHQNEIWSVNFSPDGQTLASASWDKTVKIWSSKVDQCRVIEGHEQAVTSVSFSSNSEMFATGSWDKKVNFWSFNGEKLSLILDCHEPVRSISFSPNGQLIATGCSNGSVKIWNSQGELLNPNLLEEHTTEVISVSFSPDGQTLASASEDTTVKLWDINSLNQNKPITLKGHIEHLTSVNFNPDGQTLASACWGGFVKLWSLQAGKNQIPKIIAKHDDAVMSISFSPDGKTIATASRDRTAKLWNLNGKELKIFKGHMGHLTYVSFSPDGQIIATTSRDGTVKLWSLDGKELKSLEGHHCPVSSVSFSPNQFDSKILIVSTDENGKLILWNLDNNELVELKTLNLDKLLQKGCKHLDNYLKIHPTNKSG